MKFDYKYSKGQIVFFDEKPLTIKKRCGNYDHPSYWVEENDMIYDE